MGRRVTSWRGMSLELDRALVHHVRPVAEGKVQRPQAYGARRGNSTC